MKPLLICFPILAAIPFWMAAAQTSAAPPLPRVIRHPAPPAPTDVASPPATAAETAPGVWTSELASGAGDEHPSAADCVTYRFTAWRRDGSLYSTSGLDGKAATGCLSAIMPGLALALEKMTVGEQRRVWVAASLAAPFRKSDDGETGPMIGVPLTLDLTLVNILKAPAPPLDRAHPSERAVSLPSGTFMEVLRHGTGLKHAREGQKVTVSYTSWDTSGAIVETTAMSGKQVTIPLANAPAAWRDALPLLVAGDKVRIWVPSQLTSGPRAKALVYDLELVSIE